MSIKSCTEEKLANGIKVIFMPTAKFKTISLGFFLHQELRRDLAASTALLPAVLERGSRIYPDSLTLRRELERIYGADLSTDIIKKGESHLISCSMEMVHGRYVGEKESLLRRGLAILGSIMGDPLVEGNGFKESYVYQEKEHMRKEIRGLINDKNLYSMERCISLMCDGEPFGVFKLGRLEDLDAVEPVTLFSYYRKTIARNPIYLYVVGDLKKEHVMEAVEGELSFQREQEQRSLPLPEIYREPEEVRFFQETMPVNQGKLVMGYRTNIAYGDPLYIPLLMYNGILGGFPHSKLFMNVREKASLAYYVYSRLERHKGLMLISAGIESGDYRKARGIIEEQAEAVLTGKISAAEMENTRRALVSQLRAREDNPYQLISANLEGLVGGKNYIEEELIRGLESVTIEDIQKAARKIKLDTVYLLSSKEGRAEDAV